MFYMSPARCRGRSVGPWPEPPTPVSSPRKSATSPCNGDKFDVDAQRLHVLQVFNDQELYNRCSRIIQPDPLGGNIDSGHLYDCHHIERK